MVGRSGPYVVEMGAENRWQVIC